MSLVKNPNDIRLAMLGSTPGNGHPYSWSAIFNGYDREAMTREARVLLLLDHPNVAQLVDFGEDAAGLYLVTEWAWGLTLQDIIQLAEAHQRRPSPVVLAAVGVLQFEVVQWRLQAEYNAASRLDVAPWTIMKWLTAADPSQKSPDTTRLLVPSGVAFGTDKLDQPVVLFPNEWTLRYFLDKNTDVKLHDLPLEQTK